MTALRHRWLILVGAGLIAAGCAAPGTFSAGPARASLERQDSVGECARLYRQADARVRRAGVADAQAARIPGYPYLRIDRLLAVLAPAADDPAFPAWVDRLAALDAEARAVELANLPEGSGSADLAARLDACAAVLRAHDLSRRRGRESLAAASVPDDYRLVLRVLGVYPLTSIPFLQGVRKLHRETRETFSMPLEELAVHGRLVRVGPAGGHAPLAARDVAAILDRSTDRDLGIPTPADDDLQRLLRAFAPVWEIDVASAADRPGRPTLRAGRLPQVRGDPTVYTLISHTRWQGSTLLQLNYVIWFPERPRQGPFDLVGGHLDGMIWRVTLAPDGRPLLYDVVHNCGCYHKVLPTSRVRLVERRRGWEEPLSVPQTVPDGEGPLVLRVASTTHYLQRAYRDRRMDWPDRYQWAAYRELRSLPVQGARRRSLFGPDGIVPGTRRPERWLFWPMGVPEPGAMRQWGNHAIAFVGRRHFDDPHLLERYFAPAETPVGP